jgi:hypothetical protein
MNLINKIKYYSFYKKIVKEHKIEIKKKFNLEVDRLKRMWTVITFPPEEKENIRKYGHKYIDNEVSKYVKEVDQYFREIKIFEFVKIENIEILNPLEVGVVFTYRFIKPQKIFWFKLLGILFLIIGGIILIF